MSVWPSSALRGVPDMSLSLDASAVRVFCDFLSTSHPPDDSPAAEAFLWFQDRGFNVQRSGKSRVRNLYSPASLPEMPGGLVRIEESHRWHKISVSGSALVYLRASGFFQDYIAFLASYNHRVTRLDAAADFPVDAADYVAEAHALYPSTCQLGRKAVSTKVMLAARPDGRQSGTFYVGKRGTNTRILRVYDKQLEALDRRNLEIPPCLRIEAEVSKGLASLRDAVEPAPLFFDVVSPAILKAPDDIPPWTDNSDIGAWSCPPPRVVDAGAIEQRVRDFEELGALLKWAERAGPDGVLVACRAILKRAGVTPLNPPQYQ